MTATVINTGTASLTISTISLAQSSTAYRLNHSCTQLEPNTSCLIDITFQPSIATDNLTALLQIVSDADHNPQPSLPLSGRGTEPQLVITPITLNFEAPLGSPQQKTVALENQGEFSLALQSLITTTLGSAFTATHNCSDVLAVSAQCLITITFNPTQLGTTNSGITIISNDQNSPHTISLMGLGVRAFVYLPILVKPMPITPLLNQDFSNGLAGWTQAQGTHNGNGTGITPTTNNGRLRLGDESATNGNIKVGYGAVSQRFTVIQRYLKLDYEVTTYDIVFGSNGYFDTFEVSLNVAPENITDVQRNERGCQTSVNPVAMVGAEGVLFCGGRVGSSNDVGSLFSQRHTVYIDLNEFIDQEITLYLAVWNREYDADFVNDKGYYNTFVSVDNIEFSNKTTE